MNPPLTNNSATNFGFIFTLYEYPTNGDIIIDGLKVIRLIEDVGYDLGLLTLTMMPIAPVINVAL